MTTVTLWLLISVGSMYSGSHSAPSIVVERYATKEDCEATVKAMKDAAGYGKPQIACIQSKVAR